MEEVTIRPTGANISTIMQAIVDAESYVMMVASGAYLWEYFTSLDFEWSFLTRRKRITWPMKSCINGQPGVKSPNCRAINAIVSFGSFSAVAFASMNLAIRAMALWSLDVKAVGPLVILTLGQWTLVVLNVTFPGQSFFTIGASQDIIIISGPSIFKFVPYLPTFFIYTAAFDTIVVGLTLWKLLYPWTRRARLVDRMLKDGIVYSALVMFVNIPAAIILSTTSFTPLSTTIHFPLAMLSLTCPTVIQFYINDTIHIYHVPTSIWTKLIRHSGYFEPCLSNPIWTKAFWWVHIGTFPGSAILSTTSPHSPAVPYLTRILVSGSRH
ncbi:hypothetical protein BXZ70DRAFT_1053740 [Cristinia sonorae]|uniref:Uncharacterized protein n=1 Tax=Cristinia sonorae TaxID=1940300 RepID=A0A8K0XJU9_9AGAR|nr:hypothetical protein BXZ70DRAFT_1053740 [Cristinia sonorae]